MNQTYYLYLFKMKANLDFQQVYFFIRRTCILMKLKMSVEFVICNFIMRSTLRNLKLSEKVAV